MKRPRFKTLWAVLMAALLAAVSLPACAAHLQEEHQQKPLRNDRIAGYFFSVGRNFSEDPLSYIPGLKLYRGNAPRETFYARTMRLFEDMQKIDPGAYLATSIDVGGEHIVLMPHPDRVSAYGKVYMGAFNLRKPDERHGIIPISLNETKKFYDKIRSDPENAWLILSRIFEDRRPYPALVRALKTDMFDKKEHAIPPLVAAQVLSVIPAMVNEQQLSEQEVQILKLRFGLYPNQRQRMSSKEVGRLVGKSKEQVRYAQDRALKKMRLHLVDRPVTWPAVEELRTPH